MEFSKPFFLFEGLNDAERQALQAQLSPPEVFEKGALIYSAEQFRRAIGVVLRGTLQVTRGDALLNVLSVGDMFGAAALYGVEDAYVTEVHALSACTVQFVPQEILDRWMQEDFRITKNYLRFLSGRIRFLNKRIAAFTAGAAEQRLLLWLHQHADENSLVSLPRSMADLARTLDMGRSSLYRSFEQLEKEGQIRREGKMIFVKQ